MCRYPFLLLLLMPTFGQWEPIQVHLCLRVSLNFLITSLFLVQKGFPDSQCIFQLWNQPFLHGALFAFSGEQYLEARV